MTTKKRLQIDVPVTRARADWGYGATATKPAGAFRKTVVEPDGSVLGWDEVAQCYSLHGLASDEIAEARRLAELVWSGTHDVAAGHVYPLHRPEPKRVRATWRCTCGEIVTVEGEAEAPIYGTHEGRPAWWYGCTRSGHSGTAVAFGGYEDA